MRISVILTPQRSAMFCFPNNKISFSSCCIRCIAIPTGDSRPTLDAPGPEQHLYNPWSSGHFDQEELLLTYPGS